MFGGLLGEMKVPTKIVVYIDLESKTEILLGNMNKRRMGGSACPFSFLFRDQPIVDWDHYIH